MENQTNKKYNSQKIPGQGTLYDIAEFSETNAISFDHQGFAEIEIDTGRAGNSTAINSIGQSSTEPSPIPISQSIPTINDPIRSQFQEMRNIARENHLAHYSIQSQLHNKQVQRSNSLAFYKQAEFMKDFEDDYSGSASFSAYFPSYQLMGYEQLRTYFTWRTHVRKGEIESTCLSYAFVYIYELLNNIGVEHPKEGLDRLMTFWNAYKKYDSSINKYLLRWLKDYHIVYQLPQSFHDFIYEKNIYMHYPKILQYESGSGENFDLYCDISKYDIRQSPFYQLNVSEKSNLIPDCFQYLINQMKLEFQSANLNFDQMIFYTTPKSSVWIPFEGAFFHPWFDSPDKKVVLSDREVYICRRNKWSFSTSIVMEGGKQLVSYIIKQMESVLRQMTNYKYKLTANISIIKGTTVPMLRAYGINLEKMINDTVMEYYKERNKIVVTVNEAALSQIRKEAIDTQEKLIVPETEELDTNTIPMSAAKAPLPAKHNAAGPDNTETAADAAPAEEPADLQKALTDTELHALSVILNGGNIKQFADEQQIMLEVLADSINEKAVDIIGDNILELDDAIMIYEEYQQTIMEMVRMNGK